MSEPMTSAQRSAADAVMDGGGLSGSHVPMHESEAAQWLEQIYGMRGSLSRLPAEKDDTFRVTIDGHPHSVLKVANPYDPTEELDFQIQMMKHVDRVDNSIPIPKVMSSIDGAHLTPITDAAGQYRQVWLIEHLSGRTLDTLESNSAQRETIGELLGKLRNATATFSHSRAERILAWDVRHLARLTPLVGFVEDERHRHQLQRGLERFAELQPRIDALACQILHNDFSKSNILADPENIESITGIIDFGDSVYTAVAVDVSTALLHNFPRDVATNPTQDVLAGGRDMVRGYLRVAQLTDEELSLIPHLTMGRIIARALITTRRAQLFPHNVGYIMRNTEPGWAQLDWFLDRTVDDLSQTFCNDIRHGDGNTMKPSQRSKS
ncbi:unannotated protein [freshwater metagenome]|uniref:Hydroxylysine kinase n=1 Tax=freshwater metagenome TaxID=449393 RepID=A0A6J5Z6G6_9ZZZZ